MFITPCLAHSTHHLRCDGLVTEEAHVSKELIIMGFTVSLAVLLVMLMSQERFLTSSTHKMLDMPMLAKGGDDSLLNGSMAGLADRDTHLVVARQAIEFSS